MYLLVSIGPRPQCNDTRLTEEDGMFVEENERFLLGVGGVDYEGDYCKSVISIDGSPLEVMISSGEKRWGGGS